MHCVWRIARAKRGVERAHCERTTTAQGKLDEAEPLMKEALAVKKKVFGSDHPDIATDLSNLAVLYKEQASSASVRCCFSPSCLLLAECASC